jgi:hypothetical protein
MNGEFSMRPCLLTLLLDGLSRFPEPVFSLAELRSHDEAGLDSFMTAGVLKKAAKLEQWRGPDGKLRRVLQIGALLVAIDPDAPSRDPIRLDTVVLDQVRLSLAGFAKWVAKTNGLDAPIEVAPSVWNIGMLGTADKFHVTLVAAQPLREHILNILHQRAADDFPSALLVPGAAALFNNGTSESGALTRLSSLVRNGKLDLKILQAAPPKRRVTSEDLSRQLASGIESIKAERIVEEIKSREMRAEFADMAGSADELLGKIIAGFGADEKMARLFMLLRAENPKKRGKLMTFEEIGEQLDVSKQAISAQFAKMEQKYPSAHRFITSLRAPTEVANFSEISPKERREAGIEESYNYDQS